jgi:choloylglycine hydrolase
MCTGIRLKCGNGFVAGRTAEFGQLLEYDVLYLPSGTAMSSVLPNGSGKSWTTSRATLGTATFGAMSIMDGINDAGLMVAAFYFAGYAKYSDPATVDSSKALNPTDVPNYLLTTCSTVDEALAALSDFTVVDVPVNGWGPTAPPLHYQIIDSQGRHVGVEPVAAGSLQVTENTTGAFTNSPDLPFHLLHLSQFMNISTETVLQSSVFGGTVVAPGMGSGGLGLPGDYSPPSRFVRAAFFSANHPVPNTTIDGVQELFHVLNVFDIPMGAAQVNGVSDFTQMTVVRDAKELTYAWRTYGDQRLRQVNMRQLMEIAQGPMRFPMTNVVGDESTIDDVTGQMLDSPVKSS